jgi:hypothetical protein
VFAEAFDIDARLSGETADHYFHTINVRLASDEYRPRASFDCFGIEMIATTESPLDTIEHHEAIRDSDCNGHPRPHRLSSRCGDRSRVRGVSRQSSALFRDHRRGLPFVEWLSCRPRSAPRVLLVLGTFMDMAPLIVIATPIFLPVATGKGIDPVHFGIVMILNLGIGLVTPPVGSVLFVGSAVGKVPIPALVRTIWPFYLTLIAALALVTFIPALSLTLVALFTA